MRRGRALRVCTWNVHGWTAVGGDDNFSAVAEVLADLKCDVIALQEVTSPWDRAERMAKKLRMQETVAVAGYGANVLLTRATPLNATIISSLVPEGERRSAAVAEVTAPWGATTVVATHLDHRREELRVEQWMGVVASVGHVADAIVLGDFNAHRLSDYAPGDLRWIEKRRREARVEELRGDVMAAVDDGGWVDLVRLGVAGSLDRYAASLADPIPYDLMATSVHGTRVDYVLGSRSLAAKVRVDSYRVIDDQDTGAPTDHRPVVVDLVAQPEARQGRTVVTRRVSSSGHRRAK